MGFLGWYFLGYIVCLGVVFVGNHRYFCESDLQKIPLSHALLLSLTSAIGALAYSLILLWVVLSNNPLFTWLEEKFLRNK